MRRFTKLMVRRIDWTEALEKEDEEEAERNRQAAEGNRCRLVWQGSVIQPAWKEFKVIDMVSEQGAVGALREVACEHYWNLAREIVGQGLEWED